VCRKRSGSWIVNFRCVFQGSFNTQYIAPVKGSAAPDLRSQWLMHGRLLEVIWGGLYAIADFVLKSVRPTSLDCPACRFAESSKLKQKASSRIRVSAYCSKSLSL
jgi:hypothetical protein